MPYVDQATSDASEFLNKPQASGGRTLEDLLESLPGLIYIYDLVANRNVYVNANGIALLGYQSAEFQALGDTFLSSLIHPDDALYWQEQVAPRYAEVDDSDIIESEFRIRRADGEWRWVSTHERVWQRAPDGAPQQIFAVGQDITARKESERRLDRLLRYATEGLSLIDAHGNVIYNSPSAYHILGHHLQPTARQRFTNQVHPDDRARIETAFIGLLQDPKQNVAVMVRVVRPDGTQCWLDVRATNQLAEPEVGAIVVNYIDITERMHSEAQMRYQAKLLENVNDAVIVTDLNYVVQAWNSAAQSIYGWSTEEIVGRPLPTFLQTEYLNDGISTAERMSMDSGGWHGEVLQLRKDGSRAHIFASIAQVTDVTGAPAGWVAINRDISEEKALGIALAQERAMLAQRVDERTAELRAANAELVKASQLKDDFLAAVSHELRTPMQGVLGFTENLRQGIIGPLNARQERYLDLIMESAQHLLALINNILDFTKTGAAPTKLDLLALPVIYLCESSMTMVREAALRKHLRLSLSLEDRSLIAVADERIIRQILVNLLGNAVKFTPEGGAIGIDVALDSAGERVLFTVWDTGIGIAEKDKDRLFQPFVQLDSGLNRQYGGTGLGLALSTRLAAVHGGTISLESTPGVGSRFTLSIPQQLPEAK